MNYDKELAFAKALALEAGEIMRRYFNAEDIGTTWKQDDTPLTVADTTINNLVITRVKEMFPADGVLGEEASYEPDRPRIWVVDPIDGTVPFSAGIPISTFSLGLVDRIDGQPMVAVAYDPQLDHLFTAVRGGGAFVNGKPLKVSATDSIKNNYLSILGGIDNKDFAAGKCSDYIRSQGAIYFHFVSQVYAAMKVASGQFVGTIFGYGSPWDSAAAVLIVEEAGGVATDMHGQKRRYDEWSNGTLLACNETILQVLIDAVKKSPQ